MIAPVHLPPDPNPHELRFVPPPGTCDTHFHVLGPPDLFPYVSERRTTPPAAPIEHFLALAKCLRIERAVVTATIPHGFDTASILHALKGRETFLRGVIWADPGLSTAELGALYQQGVRGIRFNFYGGPQLDSAFVLDYVKRLPDGEWVLDFFIQSNSFKPLQDLAPALPYPVVVDHYGLFNPSEDIHFRQALDLCIQPNVWFKIGGVNRLTDIGARYEDIVKLAHAFVERAPSRLIWGSDWPHTNIFVPGTVPNDGDLLNTLIDLVPDVATRNQILADNPARLFGFSDRQIGA